MKYNQMLMGILGINPYSFASPALKRLQVLCPFLIIITLTICALLAALYAYQESYLPSRLEAVALVMGGVASIPTYLNMKWKKDNVGKMNARLQEIVDAGAI